MAEKILQTRIALKIDTYTNWMASVFIPKAGEACFCTISASETGSGATNAPNVMLKVGDGTHKFSELNWVTGLAGDVYSWAKAATKPSYTAEEISGLSDYISGEIQDTDTQYTIVKGDDDYTYKLMSRAKGATNYTTEVATISIPDDTADIEALQTLVGDTAVATQISSAIDALDLANTYDAKGTAQTLVTNLSNGQVATNKSDIAAIKDGTSIDSFKDVETALAKKADTIADNTYDAYGAAADVLGTSSDASTAATVYGAKALANELNTAMDTRVDSLETLVGSTAVSSQISTAIGKLDKADTAVATQFVSAVSETDGIITVSRRTLVAADIPTLEQSKINGLSTSLAAKQDTITFNTTYNASTNKAATMADVTNAVADLSGAMHFVGVKDSLPDSGEAGDVVIVGVKEYVYDGTSWEELGDESIYLTTATAASTYETKTDASAKLTSAKSYTDDEIAKLGTMASETATDYVKKTEATGYDAILTATTASSTYQTKTDAATNLTTAKTYADNAIKALDVTDTAVATQLVSAVSETDGKISVTRRALVAADIPTIAQSQVSGLSTSLAAKANAADLADIATSGNVNDLVQTSGDVLVLNCGTSTTNIE